MTEFEPWRRNKRAGPSARARATSVGPVSTISADHLVRHPHRHRGGILPAAELDKGCLSRVRDMGGLARTRDKGRLLLHPCFNFFARFDGRKEAPFCNIRHFLASQQLSCIGGVKRLRKSVRRPNGEDRELPQGQTRTGNSGPTPRARAAAATEYGIRHALDPPTHGDTTQ